MSAYTLGYSMWPRVFTERRGFDRNAENQPYIEFLLQRFDGDEPEDEDEDDDGKEDSNDDEDKTNKAITGHVDSVGGNENERLNDDVDKGQMNSGGVNQSSKVRLFMTGLTADQEVQQYIDQVEEVAGFCEQAKLEYVDAENDRLEQRVALLDDRNLGANKPVDKETIVSGESRKALGPLTYKQLYEALSKKVVHGTGEFPNGEADLSHSVSEQCNQ